MESNTELQMLPNSHFNNQIFGLPHLPQIQHMYGVQPMQPVQPNFAQASLVNSMSSGHSNIYATSFANQTQAHQDFSGIKVPDSLQRTTTNLFSTPRNSQKIQIDSNGMSTISEHFHSNLASGEKFIGLGDFAPDNQENNIEECETKSNLSSQIYDSDFQISSRPRKTEHFLKKAYDPMAADFTDNGISDGFVSLVTKPTKNAPKYEIEILYHNDTKKPVVKRKHTVEPGQQLVKITDRKDNSFHCKVVDANCKLEEIQNNTVYLQTVDKKIALDFSD